MYFTVYKTTNLINGKIYIGIHKTENLDDGYLGSGLLINRAIEKYGKENFSKDIIAICDTEEEMYKLEESLVCQAFLTFFSTYNMKLGGDGGFDHLNSNEGISKRSWTFRNWQKSGSDKVKKLLLTDPSYKERMIKHLKNIAPKVSSYGFLGKIHTNKTRDLMKESHKGKHSKEKNSQYGTFWVTNGIENKKIKDTIPNGWSKGRTLSS